MTGAAYPLNAWYAAAYDVEVGRKLMGHLKPGGYLVLSTPSIDAPIARAMGRYWAFMTPPEHLGFFSGRSFRRLRFFGRLAAGGQCQRNRQAHRQ